jgi:general secretion pathway protein G
MIRNRKQIEQFRNDSHGFTLIELMLVTVIIGVLAGMVVVVFSGSATEAKIKAARGDIKMYESALELYSLNNNDQYPESLGALANGKKKYIKDVNTDPWGNPYNYDRPGKKHPESFDLYSNGPDGQRGTADDIAEWLKGSK